MSRSRTSRGFGRLSYSFARASTSIDPTLCKLVDSMMSLHLPIDDQNLGYRRARDSAP